MHFLSAWSGALLFSFITVQLVVVVRDRIIPLKSVFVKNAAFAVTVKSHKFNRRHRRRRLSPPAGSEVYYSVVEMSATVSVMCLD